MNPHDMSPYDSIESDLKNYKSLKEEIYEEIAQNDSKIYLNKSQSDDIIGRFVDETNSQCCCCKVHRRPNSFIAGGAVTSVVSRPFNVPIYNTIWIGEMKNATDYISYLNETRRYSFNSLNKDNRSHYDKLLLGDNNSLKNSTKFLQVPKQPIDNYLRKTPEFDEISKKITSEISYLGTSVSSLIYKSIEVHADILVR